MLLGPDTLRCPVRTASSDEFRSVGGKACGPGAFDIHNIQYRLIRSGGKDCGPGTFDFLKLFFTAGFKQM